MVETDQNTAQVARDSKQLKRLSVIIDVVYALMIFRIFMLFPKPTQDEMAWRSLNDYFLANAGSLLFVAISIAVVIVYWLQNNTLFGNLERTDKVHTSLSIAQIFCLLMYFFSIRIGVQYGDAVSAKVFQSTTAMLVGLTAWLAWRYAIKDRRLLSPELPDETARHFAQRFKAEPITALITIPCAFIGPLVWDLAWFSYPVFVKIFGRLRRMVR